jgi:galactoside O-acetyltransferase
MIGVFRKILNDIFAIFVRARVRISFGESSKIDWLALLNARHGIIEIGKNCIIRCRIAFDGHGGRVKIGDRCYLGASLLVCRSGITIGDDVVISWGVTVVDHDSHSLFWRYRQSDVVEWAQDKKNWDFVPVRHVYIGDKVWIGFGASILKGVTVGEGAVIGANSVVTRDVPPYTVVVGNPARAIRSLKQGDLSP